MVHVDAVQSPGKIESWDLLPQEIDFYTFSSHKFGGLKGIGFSFVNEKASTFEPLVTGGGQQEGLRSGTINTMGVSSTVLALEDVKKNYNYLEAFEGIKFLREEIKKKLKDKGKVIAFDSKNKNTNTIFFTVNGKDSNSLLMAFDMAGMDVGVGSACSSGALEPSRVLLNMGFSKNHAQSSLRFSLSRMNTSEEITKTVTCITHYLK